MEEIKYPESFDECNCDCHRNEYVVHAFACCHKCPKCGKNIVMLSYDKHVKECKEVHYTNSAGPR